MINRFMVTVNKLTVDEKEIIFNYSNLCYLKYDVGKESNEYQECLNILKQNLKEYFEKNKMLKKELIDNIVDTHISRLSLLIEYVRDKNNTFIKMYEDIVSEK